MELKSLKGRKTKYPVISGQVELEVTWLPLSPSPPSRSPALPPASLPRVILSVFLFSANNLGHYVSKGGAAVPVPVGYLPSARVSRGSRVKSSLLQLLVYDRRRLLKLATWKYGEVM